MVAVLDALHLALQREDRGALEELERWAQRYAKSRKPSERWLKHEAWADNATTVRSYVASVERMLAAGDPDGVAAQVREFFPYLVSWDEADYDELKAACAHFAEVVEGDARRLAERALVAAGMPAAEAHKRFAVLRQEKSRKDAARRREKTAKRPKSG